MAEEAREVDGLVADVGDAIRQFLDEPLTPVELEQLKRTLHEGLGENGFRREGVI